MQSKQPPTKRRKQKLIKPIQPINLDLKVDHYTSENIDCNIDRNDNVQNELIVRFCRLITDVLDGSVLDECRKSTLTLADGEVTEMIKCNVCLSWYHHNCVNLTIERLRSIRKLLSFGCVRTMVIMKPL